MVLLFASAAASSFGEARTANGLTTDAIYALVLGVVLQIASYLKYGEVGVRLPLTKAQEADVAPSSKGSRRTTKLAAVAAAALVFLVGVVVGYPTLSHQGVATGCSGPGTDGSLFISTNAMVSIEICGKSYAVRAGAQGGLTYSYQAGTVYFSAPASANGGAFEFWYTVIGNNAPASVRGDTLTLTLPAGLSSQNSLIQLYYSAPLVNTTSSKSSSTAASSSTSTSSGSSASSTATSCRGSDGGVFLDTDLNSTVSIDICGQPNPVSGGLGGGLDFAYRAGNVTFVAPPTSNGMRFEFWEILLPSEQEQITGNQLTINLPAGYSPVSSFIEAVYG
ncbi:MAG TPA: hypothetical protein VGS04_08140 [Nitrososphaerales archaeon]|nr:hypothetical protein [Nitrososphaerales archaeon]